MTIRLLPMEGESNATWMSRRVGEIYKHEGHPTVVQGGDSNVRVKFDYSDRPMGDISRVNDFEIEVSLGREDAPRRPAKVEAVVKGLIAKFAALRYKDVVLDVSTVSELVDTVEFAALKCGLTGGQMTTKAPDYIGPNIHLKMPPEIGEGMLETSELAGAVNVGRWLTAVPSDRCTVKSFTELVAATFSTFGDHVTIDYASEESMARMGLARAVVKANGGNMSVVTITIDPMNSTQEKRAFIGKGVMFDVGGTCIKPVGGQDMKGDKGGACSAFAMALYFANNPSYLYCKTYFTLMIADNLIGPDASRVGDVMVGYSGWAVEMDHTDAEGRLLLADGGAYTADRYEFAQYDEIWSDATLTGGAVQAAGTVPMIYLREDDWGGEKLERLGENCGSPVRCMRLTPECGDLLKSKVADMKNSAHGSQNIKGARAFEFVQRHWPKNVRAVGLDIAGTLDGMGKDGVASDPAVLFGIEYLSAR